MRSRGLPVCPKAGRVTSVQGICKSWRFEPVLARIGECTEGQPWRRLRGRPYSRGTFPTPGADISDGWRQELQELAVSLATRLRRGANAVERLVDRDPYHVAAYRGYGTPGRIMVLARVLEDEGYSAAPDAAPRQDAQPARHAQASGERSAAVRPRAGLPARRRITSCWPTTRDTSASGWHRGPRSRGRSVGRRRARSSSTRHSRPVPRAVAPILLPPASATFGVISDWTTP